MPDFPTNRTEAFREWAVRVVWELRQYQADLGDRAPSSVRDAIVRVAEGWDVDPETLRAWVDQAETDARRYPAPRPIAPIEWIGGWRPTDETLEAFRGDSFWDRLGRYPDVRNFVDPRWDANERHVVADYLTRGTLVNQFRGLSRCRFCEQRNGSAEITDGTYCWPEGLAHYIAHHDVRLPDIYVSHVRSSLPRVGDGRPPDFDDYGQRDRDWLPSRSMAWNPREEDRKLSGGYFLVGGDSTRWLRHQRP